jgi:hypothetical protein
VAANDDGAVSGILPVKAGDTLKIACQVDNTTNLPVQLGDDLSAQEMCVLYGSAVGVGID